MAMKKIKGVKKGTDKLPDPLSFSERWNEWIEKNFKFLIGGVVVLLAASAILWGFNVYRDKRENSARSDYAALFEKWPSDTADPKEWEASIPELEKFIRDHDGTMAALNAKTDLARVYLTLQRYQDAVVWSSKVIEEVPSKHPLKPIARDQLAIAYEASGKTDEALGQWKALKEEGFSGYNRVICWNMARLYAKKQDYAKAVEQYELALKAVGNYPSVALLENELSGVKTQTATPAGKPKTGQAQGNS